MLRLPRVSRNILRRVSLRSLGTRKSSNNFLTIGDLSSKELETLLAEASALKSAWTADPQACRSCKPMEGMSMAMIFQKRSTRTRVSSETGIFNLGGHALMLGPQDIQLGVNESMLDTANVLSQFNQILLARVFAHSEVEELAKHSSVPVINALSDKFHPLQTLADLQTLREHFDGCSPSPKALAGKTITYVGDGNNIIHDLMLGAIKQKMNVRVATPRGYECDEDVVEMATQLAKDEGVELTIGNDPAEAVTGTNVVVTDTWISMGQEEEAKQRKLDFQGYQVTTELMDKANDNAVFLHCLPRKPEEVTDEVFYSDRSLVFEEAGNRMWTVMAVTLRLLQLKMD